jgi:hypothetical protein
LCTCKAELGAVLQRIDNSQEALRVVGCTMLRYNTHT